MNEWTVVTMIVTLTGFLIAVISPVVKLNSAITRINTTVNALEKDMESLKQCSTQGQDRVWESNKEQDMQIADLKIRLALLEEARRGK